MYSHYLKNNNNNSNDRLLLTLGLSNAGFPFFSAIVFTRSVNMSWYNLNTRSPEPVSSSGELQLPHTRYTIIHSNPGADKEHALWTDNMSYEPRLYNISVQ